MRPPLILTKLKAPTDFGNLLLRPRLIDKLSQGMNHCVTLIHGSAGFGKTSLATQWKDHLHDKGIPVAWLSIDAEDNDLERYINYLVASIHSAEPSIDVDTVALSESKSEQTAKFILADLVNQIENYKKDIYLILDDWHLIHKENIQSALNFLIEHSPRHFHLIICSRNQPPLPVYTLQVKNQLFKIDISDLRFNEKESSTFLKQMNQLQLEPEEIHKLWKKTEGWIASLQLMLLTLRSKHFSHQELINISEKLDKNYSIGEYLVENVVNHLPQDTIDFLLQTSILDRLSGSLCDTITQRNDSQKILESLYKQGLFTRPLDAELHWFQYHHLFADFLQRQLSRQYPERIKPLHLAASDWFVDKGQTDEAVRHAIAAEEMERAIVLVEQNAMWQVEHSFMGTLLRLVDKLPAEQIKTRCHLQMSIAWAHCLTHHQTEAQASLDCVARALMRKDYPDTENIRIEARVLQACIDMYADKIDDIEQLLSPIFQDSAKSLNPWVRVVGKNVMTYVLLHTCRYDEALQLQQKARLLHNKTRGPFSNVYGDCFSGIALFKQCRLQDAETYFQRALEKSYQQAGKHSHMARLVEALLGKLYYVQNQIDKAEELLISSRTLGVEGGVADFYIATYCFSGRLEALKENFSVAYRILDEGQNIAKKLNIPRLDFSVKAELMKVYLRQNDIKSAQTLMQNWDKSLTITPVEKEQPDIIEEMFEIRERARASLLCQTGHCRQATEILQPILKTTIQHARRYGEIVVRIALSKAFRHLGEQQKAEAILLPALKIGFEQGTTRVFLDTDEATQQVIRSIYTQCSRKKITLDDDNNADFMRWLHGLVIANNVQCNGIKSPEKKIPQSPQALIEPLKEKEIKILTLLANGQTNKVIARNLNLSIDTVKWYLKSIYAKLGVSCRTQAVTEAKKLDLL